MTLNLMGKTFGRVTVVAKTRDRVESSIIWLVDCRCGAKGVPISARDLVHYKRKGCGQCGDTQHALYSTYRGMISRCYDDTSPVFIHYGARGIEVCLEWRQEFYTFVEDMGPRPQGCTLDRKDNDGPYNKENCRWATGVEQSNNQRVRSIRKLTDQDILEIYNDISSAQKILEKFPQVTLKTIYNIRALCYSEKATRICLGRKLADKCFLSPNS